MAVVVDTNVILDIVTDDPTWYQWSKQQIAIYAEKGLIVNPMTYSELCCNARSTEEVDLLLADFGADMVDMPRAALFFASKAHMEYRERGGSRQTGLPDFFIGAHASVIGVPILTRDTARYKTYFPEVTLICPENS